jgi:hypothetical protein
MTVEENNGVYNCHYCKNSFVRNKNHAKRSKIIFCSNHCYTTHKNPIAKYRTVGNTGVLERDYNKVHRWLLKKFGKASKCEFCKKTDSVLFEWALIKGMDYSFIRENYMELCISCHRKYDESDISRRNKSEAHKGRVSNNTKAVIMYGAGVTEKPFLSIKEASLQLGISRTSILNCLKGRSKTSGGFIWKYQVKK